MFKVKPIKAFDDNYIWAIINESTNSLMVVDPGDANPVMEFIENNNLSLTAILITHWHPDHTGGIEELNESGNIPVYGPDSEHIKQITHPVAEGLQTLPETSCQVIAVPGHTLDHIAFFLPEQDSLFCGDTLFAGGCGRMFEGNPEQMSHSLSKLASLPPETKVYCAHEYTLANREFSLAVEPDNQELIKQTKLDQDQRENGLPTLPSTIGSELGCNPFLRLDQKTIQQSLQARQPNLNLDSTPDLFAALRSWKDNF